MTSDTPQPGKLTPATVFERLLTYADKPWKAVVILIAIVICGLGWIVWTERARIADAVLTDAHQHATLNDVAFANDAQRLLRDTRGDMVLLVEIELFDNVMLDRIGIDTDGNRWVPSTGPQPALLPTSSMPFLVKFLANEVVCSDTAEAVNDDARALAAKGYQRICIVAVPPILGVGVGGLVVAWKQALLPAGELRAGYAMKAAAMTFATW
jgi:hypothetical protein